MGDRGNIVIKLTSGQVWFYTHNSGYRIKDAVQHALARRVRWNDGSYLARIVFDSLVDKDSHGEETGYGIGASMGDNEYPIVVVDVPKKRVYLIREESLTNDGKVPENHAPDESWSFTEFLLLKFGEEEEA